MQAANNQTVVFEPLWGTSQELALNSPCDITVYCGTRGPGKCIPIDSLVPTIDGFVKHGDLKSGDLVFGSNGQPVRVVETHERQIRPVYKFVLNDGSEVLSSDNHIWTGTIDRGVPRDWRNFTTLEIVSRIEQGFPVRLPPRAPVDRPKIPLPIDPYMLGLWVGDGSAYIRVRQPTGNRTKTRKGYIVEFGSVDVELVEAAVANNFSIKRVKDNFTWLLGKEEHKNALIELGLFGTKSDTKFIPIEVMLGDIETRLAFLQGLADTDGNAHPSGAASIATCSDRLAADIAELVFSLGGVARVKKSWPKEGGRQKLPINNVRFNFPDFVPFRLLRKIEAFSPPERMGWFCPSILEATLVGNQEVSCISVNSQDNLYAIGENYVLTHNTLTQLMRFRKRVGQGYGPYWRGLILDREFKNLSDIRAQSHRFFPKFDDGCKFLSSGSEFKWVWPTGEELLLRHAKKLSDYDQFHGWEIPSLNYNEITKHPTSELYDKMMSINRSSYRPEKDGWIGGTPGPDGVPRGPNGELPPPIPLEVFITTNPSGSGHNWCKQEFIDPAPYGQIVRKVSRVFNPQTQQEEDVVKTQVALFGSYKENKYLDPKYVAELDAIKDPNLRRAWLYGDWDVTAGGALDDLWRKEKHILPRFKVPRGWRIDRSMDWGSTHPFAVAWWAEANGEEVKLPDGATFCPPRGTLIQIGEIYATERVGSNKGLKWGPFLCAEKIIEYEIKLLEGGWVQTQPWPGPADNQIRNVIDSESDTIETKFKKKGVAWTESDKSPGSRKNGLILMRDRLEAVLDETKQQPGLYVMDNCRYSIATVPSIPRDEDDLDDVATDAEDHMYDAWRYRCLKGANRLAAPGSVKIRMPT